MLKNEMDWVLVSGATPKFEMLRSIAEELGIPNSIGQLRSPVPVDEKNHYRSSKYIYIDKARQIWEATASLLADNLGIMSDVHPKTKLHGDHQFLDSLIKYPVPKGEFDLMELSFVTRRDLLAQYIASCFGSYGRDDRVDIRQSSGTVPFFATAMIALIVQKTYIRYPSNPVPSRTAAKALLDYSREHSVDIDGNRNDAYLETSANSAGGILQSQMLEWFLRENKDQSLVVESTSEDPIREINSLGSGFTDLIVREIERLAEGYKKPKHVARDLMVKATIPLLPKKSFEIVWSRWDQRYIARKITGP